MHNWKKLHITSHRHNNRAQKLDSWNGISVLCKFNVFAKKYIWRAFCWSYKTPILKVDLISIRFFVRFCPRFLHSWKSNCSFSSAFLHAHTRTYQILSHTGQKFSEKKKVFVTGYSPILKYRCSSFMHKIFVKIRYVTV